MATPRPTDPPSPARRVRSARLGATTLAAGLLLSALFAAMVLRFGRELRAEIHEKMIGRSAALLHPMARQLISDSEASATAPLDPRAHLLAVLRSARQDGVLAMALFDSDGATLERVPNAQPFRDLPLEDYTRLRDSGPISRYHPAFPVPAHVTDLASPGGVAPLLEVLLPLQSPRSGQLLGFARYTIDARGLSAELAEIDQRIDGQLSGTLTIGTLLIAAIMAAATVALRRAQRVIAERNERLARTHFELALSSKASALGQVTSHLLHGLQGPVAGLQAVLSEKPEAEAWQAAAAYTQRLQTMIAETVGMLGDMNAPLRPELGSDEIASTLRQRNGPAAAARGVTFEVEARGRLVLDSHRASLVCLIANNLVQNATEAVARGGRVRVALMQERDVVTLTVTDDGPGICLTVQDRLFQPGRSGRAGGSGLGLAISHLLARQLGGELGLEHTGPEGTRFRLAFPFRGITTP
jgi:signal transduction histidine kinase